jgi:hypothetical protein
MPRPNWIDDPTIPGAAPLWRGVSSPGDIKDIAGRKVPSTSALITNEMSVSIGTETTQEAVLRKGQARGYMWRLWEFRTQLARNAGCLVDRDPITGQADPDMNDLAHAQVLHPDAPGKKRITPGQAKKLIEGGCWADETTGQPV